MMKSRRSGWRLSCSYVPKSGAISPRWDLVTGRFGRLSAGGPSDDPQDNRNLAAFANRLASVLEDTWRMARRPSSDDPGTMRRGGLEVRPFHRRADLIAQIRAEAPAGAAHDRRSASRGEVPAARDSAKRLVRARSRDRHPPFRERRRGFPWRAPRLGSGYRLDGERRAASGRQPSASPADRASAPTLWDRRMARAADIRDSREARRARG
jgi:hypothetical protein